MDSKTIVNEIFAAALKAVNPFFAVKEHTDKIRSELISGKFKQFFLIGFGKASYQMARAIEESIDSNLITGGIVITKYGHTVSQKPEDKKIRRLEDKKISTSQPLNFSSSQLQKSRIRIYEAGHPIPDGNGLRATEETINLLRNTDRNTLVLCLISGGGSALFVSPYNGITLNEKQQTTELLLKAGADITDLNTVRKHISKVKGGRLAEIAYPAKIIALILSDVIGDRLDVIASGPTAADNTTFPDTLNVINKFKLQDKIPVGVMAILNKGREGLIQETPKADNSIFENVRNIIICSNLKALNAAKDKAQLMRFLPEIVSSDISGEARDAGKRLAEQAIEARGTNLPAGRQGHKVKTRHKGIICLISGGETTVTVRGSGKGGRNTELALSFAREIEGVDGITLLSAGTDGTDGPTDAAGAIVNGKTVTRAKKLGLNPEKYLEDNNSYNFFKEIGSLLITGPTGTNVMDIQIIIVE